MRLRVQHCFTSLCVGLARPFFELVLLGLLRARPSRCDRELFAQSLSLSVVWQDFVTYVGLTWNCGKCAVGAAPFVTRNSASKGGALAMFSPVAFCIGGFILHAIISTDLVRLRFAVVLILRSIAALNLSRRLFANPVSTACAHFCFRSQ